MADKALEFSATFARSGRVVPCCAQHDINVSTALCFTSELPGRCCNACTTQHWVKVTRYA